MSILNIVPALKAVSPLTYNQYLFDVPGNYQWVCPPFANSITVICVGGGGGGGRDQIGDNLGAGGGGGGLVYATNIRVVPGTSYSLTVGAGGKGGISPTNGSNSTFSATGYGTMYAYGGYAPNSAFGGLGGSFQRIFPSGGVYGGGYGGAGGGFDISTTQGGGGGVAQTGGGGGGAGGYGYNGGNGGTGKRSAYAGAAGGAGGGGGASWTVYGNGNGTPSGGGGGGAGIFQDTSAAAGAAGSTSYTPSGGGGGAAGTAGADGTSNITGGNAGGKGGSYGGGGGGSNGAGNGGGYTVGDGNDGGDGVVGIVIESTIWGNRPTFLKVPTSSLIPTYSFGTSRISRNLSKLPLLGTGGSSWPPEGWVVSQNGSVDDGYIAYSGLPFSFYFNGTAYSDLYIGSNFYITFGGGSSNFSGLSSSNPAFNKIMLNASDRSYQRVVYYDDSKYLFRARVEGATGTSGTSGSPTIVYEFTVYNPAYTDNLTMMEITIGNWSAAGSGVTGLYSSTGTNLVTSVDGVATSTFTINATNSLLFVANNPTATTFSVYTLSSFAGI